jgi:hypothetical protein
MKTPKHALANQQDSFKELHVSIAETLTYWPVTGKAFFSPSSKKRLSKRILTRVGPLRFIYTQSETVIFKRF